LIQIWQTRPQYHTYYPATKALSNTKIVQYLVLSY